MTAIALAQVEPWSSWKIALFVMLFTLAENENFPLIEIQISQPSVLDNSFRYFQITRLKSFASLSAFV